MADLWSLRVFDGVSTRPQVLRSDDSGRHFDRSLQLTNSSAYAAYGTEEGCAGILHCHLLSISHGDLRLVLYKQ